MVEETVATVEEVAASVVATISLGLPGIALRGLVLPATGSHRSRFVRISFRIAWFRSSEKTGLPQTFR